MMKDIVPDMRGERSQLKAISDIVSQSIAENDNHNIPKPTIPPTMVWVVETGHPK